LDHADTRRWLALNQEGHRLGAIFKVPDLR
jgi:hypothetical protein